MRKLSGTAHYGTSRPGLGQASRRVRIFLVSGARHAKIDINPFLIQIKEPRASGPASGPAPAAGKEETMNSSERRIDTRVNIRVPLRFRVLNDPEAAEQAAESENISQRGIYFATNVPLKVGTPLEVSLRMPRELAGKTSSDVRCVARVVHVQPDSGLGGRAGIGLHIEHYEAKASALENWAS